MLEQFCGWLVYSQLGLSADSALGQSVHFFIYDSVKILLLLYVMIGLIGIGRTYLPASKIKKWLSKGRYGIDYLAASLFGAVTPFCSCSSIPIFISFIKAGVPLGPTFSFLVTSPLINEYLVVLMLGFFGVKITLAYIVVGIVLGVAAGMLINSMGLQRFIVEDMRGGEKETIEEKYVNFSARVSFGKKEANDIIKKLWVWVLVGVGVGAVIHGFIPEEIIHSLLDRTGIFSVPLATILGIPIYANCAAVVPIAVVLFEKGVPLGTALSFMMATAALSLPEAVILRRVMKLHLIALFFAIVGTGIILIGYLFNLVVIS